jgi:hypothetical protein
MRARSNSLVCVDSSGNAAQAGTLELRHVTAISIPGVVMMMEDQHAAPKGDRDDQRLPCRPGEVAASTPMVFLGLLVACPLLIGVVFGGVCVFVLAVAPPESENPLPVAIAFATVACLITAGLLTWIALSLSRDTS